MTFSTFPRVERTAPSNLSSLICLSSFGFGLRRRLGDFGAGASGDRAPFWRCDAPAWSRLTIPIFLLPSYARRPDGTPLSPLRRHFSGLVGLRRADLRKQLIGLHFLL